MLRAYGLRDSRLYPVRGPLFRAFVAHTRLRYLLLARRTARDIEDFRRAGVRVLGVVGVGGSPSCGAEALKREVDAAASTSRSWTSTSPARCGAHAKTSSSACGCHDRSVSLGVFGRSTVPPFTPLAGVAAGHRASARGRLRRRRRERSREVRCVRGRPVHREQR
jgi:hypothetical protein